MSTYYQSTLELITQLEQEHAALEDRLHYIRELYTPFHPYDFQTTFEQCLEGVQQSLKSLRACADAMEKFNKEKRE